MILRRGARPQNRIGIAGHSGRIFDLAFCPVYSGVLASASDDSSLRLWQVSDEHPGKACKQAGICSGHQDSVLRVTWHSDGRLLASGPAVPMEWLQIARLAFATSMTTLYIL